MTTLKQNLAKSATNYSTYAIIVFTALATYWMQMPAAEQAALIAAYPWLKHAAPLAGLITYLARVIPQGGPPLGEAGDTEPMGPP